MFSTLSQFNASRLSDPFLTPDWRHARVVEILSKYPIPRCSAFDDQYIRIYRQFKIKKRNEDVSSSRLAADDRNLFFADKIYETKSQNSSLAMILEAKLLAAVPNAEIAKSLKTTKGTVDWYARLFFDVSDFLGNKDWIVSQVLLPCAGKSLFSDVDDVGDPAPAEGKAKTPRIVTPFLDWSLKLFSYFGGPKVCDALISGFEAPQHVQSSDGMISFFHSVFMRQLAQRSAQAVQSFDVNRYNVMELLSLNTSVISMLNSQNKSSDTLMEIEQHILRFLTTVNMGVRSESDDRRLSILKGSNVEPDLLELQKISDGEVPGSFLSANETRFQDLNKAFD
jgi:hypothetical protein